MEHLIEKANDKLTANNQKVISDITSLCVHAVIFSDFEIEQFFNIENFNPNFQRNILLETISFCYDRQEDQENYIYLKFQFWVLKMANHIYSGNRNRQIEQSLPISNVELLQSLESLNKVVQKNSFDKAEVNLKCLILKISYEMGMYYYFKDMKNEMVDKLNFLLDNIDTIPENKIKTFYFDIDKVKKLLNFIQYDNMEIDDKEEGKLNYQQVEFEIESDMIQKDFEEKFSHILNTTISDNDNNAKITGLNIIEYSSLKENLLKSENLITLSMKNTSILQEAIKFVNQLQLSITSKISRNPSKEEENELTTCKKEIKYHETLLSLIEMFFKGDEKLPRNFLTNLSKIILSNTLTDNLRISGLIHGLILNFPSNFKIIYNYFSEFVNFFMNTQTQNKIETVNQIVFISRILSILYLFNNPNDKDKNTIIVNEDNHLNLMNIFFFWLEKADKIPRKQNIAFILVKTMKIVDYLHILKIIYIGVLKFILEKKHLTMMDNTNEIFDCIYEANPGIFKIDHLLSEELKNITKVKINKIEFKQSNQNQQYKFDSVLTGKYINILIQLISKIEKKIILYNKTFTDYDIIHRKINLNFFNLIENFQNISLEEKGSIINDYCKMFKLKFEEFRKKYFTFDIISNISDSENLYEEFKRLLSEHQIIRFIYVLSCNNRFFEAAILSQYLQKNNFDLVNKLLKKALETSNINFYLFQYIWKTVYFEYLSNYFYSKKNEEALNKIQTLIKRVSNHQFFETHPLRKHFKIVNFFKILDNIY